jgi:hypothetical protein
MARHRAEVENIVKRSGVVLVAGGHVAVLLYRMRLFGLADLLQGRTVIGWAAGAMALSERVVLFHDDLPFGPGHAESLDDGLGLARGIVPLPHASRRLRLDDPARVSLFARRFAPAVPVALDPESRVDWNGDRWTSPSGTRRLTKMGDLEMLAS